MNTLALHLSILEAAFTGFWQGPVYATISALILVFLTTGISLAIKARARSALWFLLPFGTIHAFAQLAGVWRLGGEPYAPLWLPAFALCLLFAIGFAIYKNGQAVGPALLLSAFSLAYGLFAFLAVLFAVLYT